jgi:hypothetical protein
MSSSLAQSRMTGFRHPPITYGDAANDFGVEGSFASQWDRARVATVNMDGRRTSRRVDDYVVRGGCLHVAARIEAPSLADPTVPAARLMLVDEAVAGKSDLADCRAAEEAEKAQLQEH